MKRQHGFMDFISLLIMLFFLWAILYMLWITR